MSPCLTSEEIYDIVKPLTQPAAQVRELHKLGIRADRRKDGSVRVLRVWYELADHRKRVAESKPTLRSERVA